MRLTVVYQVVETERALKGSSLDEDKGRFYCCVLVLSFFRLQYEIRRYYIS